MAGGICVGRPWFGRVLGRDCIGGLLLYWVVSGVLDEFDVN